MRRHHQGCHQGQHIKHLQTLKTLQPNHPDPHDPGWTFGLSYEVQGLELCWSNPLMLIECRRRDWDGQAEGQNACATTNLCLRAFWAERLQTPPQCEPNAQCSSWCTRNLADDLSFCFEPTSRDGLEKVRACIVYETYMHMSSCVSTHRYVYFLYTYT